MKAVAHNWAKRSESIIIKTIRDHYKKPLYEIEKALFDAYPFGERAHYPYQIWCKKKKSILDSYIKVNKLRPRF
jgi:hypothetical protein